MSELAIQFEIKKEVDGRDKILWKFSWQMFSFFTFFFPYIFRKS